MRAVILAAGRGSRMGGLTDNGPKCTLPVGGRSLLDRQTRALRQAGVQEIGIVTGWRHETLAGAEATLFHNPRWADSTMVESLAAAGTWLAQDVVLVAYGDIVFSPSAVRRLAAAEGLAIAYDPDWEKLWRLRFADPLDDAETFLLNEAGHLLDIGGTPAGLAEVQGQYMGLLRFTPAAWSLVCRLRARDPGIARKDMTGLLRHLVHEGLMSVTAVAAPEPWCEFDQPSDLEVGRHVLALLDEELDRAAR